MYKLKILERRVLQRARAQPFEDQGHSHGRDSGVHAGSIVEACVSSPRRGLQSCSGAHDKGQGDLSARLAFSSLQTISFIRGIVESHERERYSHALITK